MNGTYEVVETNGKNEYVKECILKKHYAQRKPSISFAYILRELKSGKNIGVITYGKPASNSLCVGVCGEKYSKNVYELNRLFIEDGLERNIASWFISKTERYLKKHGDFIIVSYSDKGMNHNGYVYQASNFIYTGATKERTDKYTPNGKHSRHYSNEYNHLRKLRTSKNRYIKFIGNKRFKKDAISNLNYKIFEYPKEENSRYRVGDRIKTKIIDTNNGNIFYE